MALPAWCSEPSSGSVDPARLWHQLRVAPKDASGLESPDNATEQEIVTRIRAGDVNVFETVYRSTYAPLWQFAYRLTRSADVAQDVVQDVFMNIWERRQAWSVHTTVRAYLYGAVRQRSLKHIRHQRVVADKEQIVLSDSLPPGMGTFSDAPDMDTERHAIVDALRKAIATLHERQQLAMVLYLEGDLTPVEIAAALAISPAASRKLLAKAAAHLRAILPEP